MQSSRTPAVPPMAPEEAQPPIKAPLTPFRRNRSRVFYASDDALSESRDHETFSSLSSPTNTLRINVNSPSSLQSGKVFSRSSPSCAIAEENEDQSNSADEEIVSSLTESCSPVCSPAVSWRGSDRSSNGSWRGSPSQRSQDSGYSDSGESSSGGPTDESPCQPQVKHITRIYFGDYQRLSSVSESTQTPSAGGSSVRLRVPKTGSFSTQRTFKSGKRRTSRGCHGKPLSFSEPRVNVFRVEDRGPTRTNISFSPTTSSATLDEAQSLFEHKSLSCTSLPVEQTISNNVRKYSNISEVKKSSNHSEVKNLSNPSEVKDLSNPSDVKKSSNPSEVKNLSNPSDVKKSSNPSEVKKSSNPSEVQKSSNPSEVKRSPNTTNLSELNKSLEKCEVDMHVSPNEATSQPTSPVIYSEFKKLTSKTSDFKKSSKATLKGIFSDRRKSKSFEEDSEPVVDRPPAGVGRQLRRVFHGKRMIKKFLSEEKLTEVANIVRPRRQEPLKARRRWSAADFERCSTPLGLGASGFGTVIGRLSPPQTISESQLFNRSAELSHPVSPLQVAERLGNDSLLHWLGDLSRMCESECMNTLQSKSLYSEPPTPAAASTHAHLASIQKRAHVVSAEFALLCQRLEHLQLRQVPCLVKSLVSYVLNFVKEYYEDKGTPSKSKDSLPHQVRVVEQICGRLTEICVLSRSGKVEGESEVEDEDEDKEAIGRIAEEEKTNFDQYYYYANGQIETEKVRELVQIVTALGHAFTKLVDILLCQGIKSLVTILEEELDEREVDSAVTEITTLGVSGSHICKLVGRVGGIRALLEVCIEPRFRRTRAMALRALATVCCVAEGIDNFEKEGGVDVVSEVLCNPKCPEEERAEAAGVLAQVTSPWVEDNHSLPFLHEHLLPLTAALTGLAATTASPEVFLLTSAALANLTFLDSSCVDALLQSSTHKILLKEIETKDDLSVFTKDQIATILASMSGMPAAAKEVVASGGIQVLVSLLNTEPTDSYKLPEIAATERVQQKSAIALSRLSTDPTAANQVLTEGGAARLVHLCKNENARNHSDAVLVACLAALRKIATSCGNEELRHVDAAELIEPRLLDSFLIYSSQQESFV